MSYHINIHYLSPRNQSLIRRHSPCTNLVPQQDSSDNELETIEPKNKRKGTQYTQVGETSTENLGRAPTQETKKIASSENTRWDPTWTIHSNLEKSNHTETGETKDNNDLQTWRYLQQITLQ